MTTYRRDEFLMSRGASACTPASDTTKTRGQIAYEADVAAYPTDYDGTPRRPWERLTAAARWIWERDPVR